MEAQPAANARFLNWSGDVPSGEESQRILNLAMNGHRTLTANFDLAPQVQPGIFNIDEDQELLVSLEASDDNANPPEIVVTVGCAHGVLRAGADALHPVYTPDSDWHGTDTSTIGPLTVSSTARKRRSLSMLLL